MTTKDDGTLRGFDTGATRDTATGKIDMEGFTCPKVMLQYAKFMNMNRLQSDGQLRDSDNWQKGIPIKVYMKSMKRHFDEVWMEHRYPGETEAGMIAALCGLMFNSMGMLHEWLKIYPMQDFDGAEPTPEMKIRQDQLLFTKCVEQEPEKDNCSCGSEATIDGKCAECRFQEYVDRDYQSVDLTLVEPDQLKNVPGMVINGIVCTCGKNMGANHDADCPINIAELQGFMADYDRFQETFEAMGEDRFKPNDWSGLVSDIEATEPGPCCVYCGSEDCDEPDGTCIKPVDLLPKQANYGENKMVEAGPCTCEACKCGRRIKGEEELTVLEELERQQEERDGMCSTCRWQHVNEYNEPCRSCLMKAKQADSLFSLYMPGDMHQISK